MKYIKKIAFILTLFLVYSPEIWGQDCDATKYKEQCKAKLASGFTYEKYFEIKPTNIQSNNKWEFSCLMNKGSLYMLNMMDASGKEMNFIIELYNQNNKLVATNYDSRTGKFWPIGFACNESGVHYLRIKPKDPSKKCGIVVMGSRS